jgi:hypothetical protein
MLLPW